MSILLHSLTPSPYLPPNHSLGTGFYQLQKGHYKKKKIPCPLEFSKLIAFINKYFLSDWKTVRII